MADVQLDEVRDDGEQRRDVRAVQAVAGVDLQAQFVRLGGGGGEAFQLGLALAGLAEALGVSAGVELDELAAGIAAAAT